MGGLGAATFGLGLDAVGGAYEGTNNMQQEAPQQQISLRQPRAQPRVQQPMVSRMDAGA